MDALAAWLVFEACGPDFVHSVQTGAKTKKTKKKKSKKTKKKETQSVTSPDNKKNHNQNLQHQLVAARESEPTIVSHTPVVYPESISKLNVVRYVLRLFRRSEELGYAVSVTVSSAYRGHRLLSTSFRMVPTRK